MRSSVATSLVLILSLVGLSMPVAADATDNKFWPQWRGPLATGIAPQADPPIEWSETSNVAWKVEMPGKGAASPIVWGERIFVLTAVPVGDPVAPALGTDRAGQSRGPRGVQASREQQFTILALDRATGETLWKRVLRQQIPHEGTHATGTWASPSPVTDGEHVWASFGSFGLYCLNVDGNLVWEVDLGDMSTRRAFGEGSSPALFGDTLVVNWDHEGDSFIVALDKATGRERWRRDRDEITSWSTPLIVEHGGVVQAIVSATGKVRGYDLADGEVLWELGGMTVNVIPTPVHRGAIALFTSGFRGNAMFAIDLDKARGDLTGSDAILWSLDRDTPYTPSPLLYGRQLYFLKTNDGILSSHDLESGERHFGPVRLESVRNVYASPVGAAGRVYIASRDGETVVLAHGPEYRVLAVNHLDDGFDASPALVDDELYLRGRIHLYRISAGG